MRQRRVKLYRTATAAHVALRTKGYLGSLDRYRRLERGEVSPDYGEMQIIASEFNISLDAWVLGKYFCGDVIAALDRMSPSDLEVAKNLVSTISELISAKREDEL